MNPKQDTFKTLISRHIVVEFQKVKSKEEKCESRLGCRRRKQKEGRLITTVGTERQQNVFICWKKSMANVELGT